MDFNKLGISLPKFSNSLRKVGVVLEMRHLDSNKEHMHGDKLRK